jgi:hypothetical protein
MKKIIIILLLLGFFVYVFSEDDLEDQLEGSVETEDITMDGQACYDYLDGKNFQEGDNERKGKSFFIAVGIDSSGANMNQLAYVDSIQNAFTRAQMNAKTALAESLEKKIKSEIVNEFKQAFKEGKKPTLIIQEKDNEADSYEDLSSYQKMKILMHQKLDEIISQDNKDKVGEKEREMEKEMEGILNQNVFRESIEATAKSNIRGMKTLYSNLSAKPGSNRTTVCNVAIWSENLTKYADAMSTGNFSKLRNLKKGKPLKQYVPKDQETLGVTFGAFMVRNEKGEMSVISYSQSGLKTSSSTSEKAAFIKAKLQAERAIMQLRSENVEVAEKIDSFEVTTEKTDGMTDVYSEENIERRQKASASGSLRGAKVIKRWKNKHPVTGRLVAGMVVGWSPSSADFASGMKETLDKSPESSGSDYSPSPITAKEVESGSSMGDDEDDF